MVYFGIGCLTIDVERSYLETFTPERPFTPEVYAELVSNALRRIPGVEELDVEPPSGFRIGYDSVSPAIWWTPDADREEAIPMREGGASVVEPMHSRVSFNLTVSASFQRDRSWVNCSDPNTKFFVEMFGTGSGPAAIVWDHDDEAGRSQAPTSVAIVRDYLEDEFGRRSDVVSPATFDSLGPSPMHVEPSLVWMDTEELAGHEPWTDAIWQPVRSGYTQLTLILPGREVGVREASATISEALAEEAALFYELVRLNRWMSIREHDLLSDVETWLAWSETARGISRFKKAASTIEQISLEALRLKSDLARARKAAREWIADCYAAGDPPAVKPLMDDEIEKLSAVLDPASLELIELLEQRKSGRMERTAVLLAGAFGAAGGAALTALLT